MARELCLNFKIQTSVLQLHSPNGRCPPLDSPEEGTSVTAECSGQGRLARTAPHPMPEHEAGGPGVERAQGEGLSSSLPGLHRAGCTSESGRMPAVRGHGSGGGPGQAPSQAAGVQWERAVVFVTLL